jgi:hypothetical protein
MASQQRHTNGVSHSRFDGTMGVYLGAAPEKNLLSNGQLQFCTTAFVGEAMSRLGHFTEASFCCRFWCALPLSLLCICGTWPVGRAFYIP